MRCVTVARILPMASSKDYKRIGDNDEGPNTGGMGAHSPAGVASFTGVEEILEMAAGVMENIMYPVASGMADENRVFRGFLYAGLVLTDDGIKTLEFNVRLGDPEAQPS